MIQKSFAAAALTAALIAPGCSGQTDPAASAEEAPPTEYQRELTPVLKAELERTGAADAPSQLAATPELRTDRGTLPANVERAGDNAEPEGEVDRAVPQAPEAAAALLEELVDTVVASPRQLPIARLDVEDGGEDMAMALAAALSRPDPEPARLKALIDLTQTAPSGLVARALARVGTVAGDPGLRARAVRALDHQLGAEGADAVLPALLLRLKYERDGSVLRAIEERTSAMRSELDGNPAGASLALEGQVWRWISDVSGEHFQLRGVDDARFVLARLGSWAAPYLGRALYDSDGYVRLHVCQILERMGTGAAGAGPALIDALYDPNAGVAGAAAEALVAAVGSGAEAPLLRRLDQQPPLGADPGLEAPLPYELKVALARALARLPGEPPADRLEALFAGAPTVDLKLAAAEGLLRTTRRNGALTWLADELVAAPGMGHDPAGAEDVAGRWIASGADEALRRVWAETAPTGERIHTPDEARARRMARAVALGASARERSEGRD